MENSDDTTLFTVEEILMFAAKEGIDFDPTRPSFQRMMNEFNLPFKSEEAHHGK